MASCTRPSFVKLGIRSPCIALLMKGECPNQSISRLSMNVCQHMSPIFLFRLNREKLGALPLSYSTQDNSKL